MTFYVENETDRELPFSAEDTVRLVCEAVLEEENCPYEVQVNVVLTDQEGIRELNREYRGIDRETDVLSFPNVVITSHQGFFTKEALAAIAGTTLQNATDFEAGRESSNDVKQDAN